MNEEQTEDWEDKEATMIPDLKRSEEIIWDGWSLKDVHNFNKNKTE